MCELMFYFVFLFLYSLCRLKCEVIPFENPLQGHTVLSLLFSVFNILKTCFLLCADIIVSSISTFCGMYSNLINYQVCGEILNYDFSDIMKVFPVNIDYFYLFLYFQH